MVICKATPTTATKGIAMPFTMAQVLGPPRNANDDVLVCWWIPGESVAVNFKPGKKKTIVDLFGRWRPLSSMTVQELAGTLMPEVLVGQQAVLEMNFELTADDEIPFSCFDSLRTKHGVDCTSLTYSLTKRGNLYRRFALLGCNDLGES
jgi:hypothetical protein